MLRALDAIVKRHFMSPAPMPARMLPIGLILAVILAMLPLQCATLERLSLDDMIGKSTAIVRGKVLNSWAALTGSIIYTHYKIEVGETYKGTGQNGLEIVVTGGTVNGVRQNFSGSPVLKQGDQFVFFLWTSKAGLTQILGLTQGLFTLEAASATGPSAGASPGASAGASTGASTGPVSDAASDPVATRAPTRELMLDPVTARPVKDGALSLRLSQLRSRITATLAANPGAH